MAAGHFRIGLAVRAGLTGIVGIAGLVLAGCASATHAAGSASPTTQSTPPGRTVSSTPTAVTPTPTPTSSAPAKVPASTPRSSSRAASPPASRPSPRPAHKVPPDAQYPAAGACERSTGSVVQVTVNPDVPTPRCVTVSASQTLRVFNNTNEMNQPPKTVTIKWADYASRILHAGASTSFPQPFGDYLLPGVHFLHISLYGGSSAEIWLKG